jgi:hypothetical protein
MIRRALGCALGLALAIVTPAARADLSVGLTPSVSFDSVSSLYTYQYLVSNTSDPTTGDSLADFTLAVPTTADLSAIVTPAGWGASYTAGDQTIDWSANDFSSLLAPGQSLTFALSSPLGPGDTLYSVTGLTPDLSGVDTLLGATQGPQGSAFTAVPEPSSLALVLLVGIPGAIGWIWRRGWPFGQRRPSYR